MEGRRMALPKVSIVIPTYKPGHFEQCLRSAIGQTYPNIEILVSDNCPTEDIRDICNKFPSVIYQRSTIFRTENVLRALFAAKGVYIKPLLDDDLLHPFAVERMVTAIELHDDIQMVFSRSATIDANNVRTADRRPYQKSGMMSGRDMIRSMILNFRNFVGELSTIMFRRDRIWAMGSNRIATFGSQDFLRGLTDVAIYFALVRDASMYYIDEELSYFRWDMSTGSNSNPNANPDFGILGSDWVDLLIEALREKFVTPEEFLGVKPLVEILAMETGWGRYAEVQQAQSRYEQVCKTIRA
jgi:glycosyltransferase involved in cell wall biosynthesis